MSDVEFSFEIGAYSPETIPMERLGAYMADLGAMLGDQGMVQFLRLEKGSTRLCHRIRLEAVSRVEKTVTDLWAGTAEPSKQKAFASLNRRLRDDNAEGIYRRNDTGAVILEFPGVRTREPEVIGPIEQTSIIDGVLISLGGRDNTVPVRVQSDGVTYVCSATREMARQLAPFIFSAELRLTGTGKWLRHEIDGWRLELFKIESFEPLKSQSLLAAVAEIRSTKAEWDKSTDWDELIAGDEDA